MKEKQPGVFQAVLLGKYITTMEQECLAAMGRPMQPAILLFRSDAREVRPITETNPAK
jgi:hypothetical protein